MIDLKQELISSIKSLTLIEDEIENYVSKLNELDLRIQEILHYYEYNKISTNGHSSLSRKLQELQIERRNVKNMYELYGTYQSNKMKLIESGNRDILISEIFKKEKALDTKYRNTYFTEEELNIIARNKEESI